jgi:hypothetical protein
MDCWSLARRYWLQYSYGVVENGAREDHEFGAIHLLQDPPGDTPSTAAKVRWQRDGDHCIANAARKRPVPADSVIRVTT